MSDAPIFYLCGDTVCNAARSGIQTVVRSLAGAFGARRAPVHLVTWQEDWNHLRPLGSEWSLGLGAEALRDRPDGWPARLLERFYPLHRRAPAGSWVLLPELMYRDRWVSQLIDQAHRRGWRFAAILHDAIPVFQPGFVPPDLPAIHANYLRGLSQADLILPNSESTAQRWREFLAHENLAGPPVRVCTLACDLSGIARVRTPALPDPAKGKRMLCVSTLEPRKNHGALFAAFQRAAAGFPDLELDLVGASHASAPTIAADTRALASRFSGRVRWHERVDQPTLRQLYADSDFTVYPSVLEGFGLPVIESLWFARPCICANFGVMAENAAGGGCLTVDVRDPAALAEAVLALATSDDLRLRLALQAAHRPLKTWAEYADEVLGALRTV